MTDRPQNERHNFVVLLLSHVCTKIGDGLLNPKTTLTWLMTALSAPSFLTGLLVPIRESGSMWPQLLLAGGLQRLRRRKWAWMLGAWGQGLCVFAMAAVAVYGSSRTAGLTIIGCLALFAIARSICSITGKDVLGRTIPKRRRGRLTGWQSSTSGLVVLGIGLALGVGARGRPELETLALLLVGAAVLWGIGGALMAALREPPDETANGNGMSMKERIGLLKGDAPFRRFVIARACMMGSALIAPYYVVIAQERTGGIMQALGYLIVASGLAPWLSSAIWGHAADRSSRRVMMVASYLSAGLGVFVLTSEWLWSGEQLANPFWYTGIFFVAVVAHSGVRVGRKTYVVDLGGDDKRVHYVAVSNTFMGLLLLVAGAIGGRRGNDNRLLRTGSAPPRERYSTSEHIFSVPIAPSPIVPHRRPIAVFSPDVA